MVLDRRFNEKLIQEGLPDKLGGCRGVEGDIVDLYSELCSLGLKLPMRITHHLGDVKVAIAVQVTVLSANS